MSTVTDSGPLSLTEIARVFGDTPPYVLTDYYRDGPSGLVRTNFTKTTTKVPTTGSFPLTSLYSTGTVVSNTIEFSVGISSLSNYTATEVFSNPVGQWGTYYFPTNQTLTITGIPTGSKVIKVTFVITVEKQLSDYGTTLYATLHKDDEAAGFPVIISASAINIGASDYSKKTLNVQQTTDVPLMGLSNGSKLKFSVTYFSGSVVKIYYAAARIGYGY